MVLTMAGTERKSKTAPESKIEGRKLMIMAYSLDKNWFWVRAEMISPIKTVT